jgi:hypothetical protein
MPWAINCERYKTGIPEAPPKVQNPVQNVGLRLNFDIVGKRRQTPSIGLAMTANV